MSTAAELREAVLGVFRRDARLFWSTRLRVVTQTLALFFSLTIFRFVSRLVNVPAFPRPDDYFAYVAIGLVVLALLTATLTALPLAVRQELVAGTFERFAVSATGAVVGVAAMLLFPLVSGLAFAAVQMVLAILVFGLDIRWSTAALALPVGLLSGLAFAPFAMLLASTVVVGPSGFESRPTSPWTTWRPTIKLWNASCACARLARSHICLGKAPRCSSSAAGVAACWSSPSITTSSTGTEPRLGATASTSSPPMVVSSGAHPQALTVRPGTTSSLRRSFPRPRLCRVSSSCTPPPSR
jgi:ABC-type transport system involved in cytochrome c biogenesis permease component